MRFHVFVYGTLKHGGWNHDEWCNGCLSVEPATVRGRLNLRHSGTPILEVPVESVLSHGTARYEEDVRRTAAFDGESRPLVLDGREDWTEVRGEILTFEEAGRLAQLDELEEFFPGSGDSVYERVLIQTLNQSTAWTYVIPQGKTHTDYQPAKNPAEWDPFVEISAEQWLRRFGTNERIKSW